MDRRNYLKYAGLGLFAAMAVGAGYFVSQISKSAVQTPTTTEAFQIARQTETTAVTTSTSPIASTTLPFDFSLDIDYADVAMILTWDYCGQKKNIPPHLSGEKDITISAIAGIPQEVALGAEGVPSVCTYYFTQSEGIPPFKSELMITLNSDYRGSAFPGEKYQIVVTARSVDSAKSQAFELWISECYLI